MKNWFSLLLNSLAICATSVLAQTNFTAYVNKSMPPGLTLICNPLNTTNNSIGGLFGGASGRLPEGSRIYLWTGTGYTIGTRDDSLNGGWSPAGFANQDFSPGKGAIIENVSPAMVTITFVGQVLVGSMTNHINAGYQLLGCMLPQAGRVDTVLGLPIADGDQIYRWNGQAYSIFTADFLNDPAPWGTNAPVIDVAESFFSRKTAAVDWIRNFQPP